MFSVERKQEILDEIRKMEAFQVEVKGRHAAIRDHARRAAEDAAQLREGTDALMPVLRTALVINARESFMEKRYDAFRAHFPEIKSLADLQSVMKKTEYKKFCSEYLGVNIAVEKEKKYPKYCLLETLVDGFLSYQKSHRFSTEILAIRHWAENVDVKNLTSDPIGKRHGVGEGVLGNIRITLGMDAVKPDRHVIGVMQEVLKIEVPLDEYGRVVEELEIVEGKRYFDEVLFRYGKAQKISASWSPRRRKQNSAN